MLGVCKLFAVLVPPCWGLDNAAVGQKVSALCGLPRGSSGAKPQRGSSLSSHSCVNAPWGVWAFPLVQGMLVRVFTCNALTVILPALGITPGNLIYDNAFSGMVNRCSGSNRCWHGCPSGQASDWLIGLVLI